MNPIEKKAIELLEKMVENDIRTAHGEKLAELTDFSPQEINDAVDYLKTLGTVEILNYLGTDPYDFGDVSINSKGMYFYYELNKETQEIEQDEEDKSLPNKPFNPVGSPYGFTEDDWEFVSLRKSDNENLYVVLGMQFESENYDSDKLVNNIEGHFQKALESYNTKQSTNQISLHFDKLSANYGEHLFNAIAKSIISSDIAVFEISDQNPNVMLELGVALTWGIRVLPLRLKGSPMIPSDISGHTWVEHINDCERILDSDFNRKLEIMIERAIAKK